MALRFQDKDDEVDLAAKVGWRGFVALFVFGAAITGVVAWVSGDSLHSYEQNIAVGAACLWVWWIVGSLYSKISTRTREIHGIVTEMERAVAAVREDQKELLERLKAIEDEMHSLK